MSPKTLTNDEVDAILKHTLDLREFGEAWRKAVRNYTMIVLMLDTGLRVGELVSLQMSDLFFDGKPVNTMVVRSAIAKSKTERTVPMSLRAGDALKLFAQEHHYLFGNVRTSFPFGKWMPSEPLSTRQVERIVRKIAMESIGRPVHPHVFRHTFATRLMRVTDSRTVQELLGHKHITSTQIYTHPDENDKKKAIDNIESERAKLERHGIRYESPRSVSDGANTSRTNRDV